MQGDEVAQGGEPLEKFLEELMGVRMLHLLIQGRGERNADGAVIVVVSHIDDLDSAVKRTFLLRHDDGDSNGHRSLLGHEVFTG